MRDLSLNAINDGMKSSDLIRIQYSAKQASIANAWKKWIGQIDGLRTMDAVTVKVEQERAYVEMAKTKVEWKKYADVVDKMNALVAAKSDLEFQYAMGAEYLSYGPEYFKLARGLNDLITNYSKYKEKGELNSVLEKLKTGAEGFFKNYNDKVDRQIFEQLTFEYLKQINQLGDYKNEQAIKSLTDLIYSKSVLTDKQRYLAFLEKFNEKRLKKIKSDFGLNHYLKYVTRFRNDVIPGYQNYSAEMNNLLQLYVEGKFVMFPNDKHWPDANSTLRITYGQLEGSAPTDGMMYTEHTTLDGMIAKYYSGNPDMELLPRMLELHKAKNYGPYAQGNELWVCFTGSNHTTGGNSGSPVLDANGHLMGLNFDRTWESTMSDYMFDASRCRNVVVDIRYVMWVMDIYSGAKHLVDEMNLVKE
jgi:hypothetical protein